MLPSYTHALDFDYKEAQSLVKDQHCGRTGGWSCRASEWLLYRGTAGQGQEVCVWLD